MTSNVEKVYPKGADNVLEQAMGEYSEVIILGYDKDGTADYRVTDGLTDGGDILWLLEVFKHKLLSGEFSKTD